jgi:hypothetical protein
MSLYSDLLFESVCEFSCYVKNLNEYDGTIDDDLRGILNLILDSADNVIYNCKEMSDYYEEQRDKLIETEATVYRLNQLIKKITK